MEVLKEAIDAGKIKNVGEAYTDGWLPANAQKNMEQFLTANDNKSTRWWLRMTAPPAARSRRSRAQGLAGSVPVSGQDGDHRGAEPHRARHPDRVGVEGRARARQERRRDRRRSSPMARRWTRDPGTVAFNGARRRRAERGLPDPVPITKDNLNVVIDAGWVPKDVVCQGVPAGSVAACN
jgi:D-xylose transport system substrate-binding protein